MSTTFTANIKLAQPALGDTGWSTPLNGNTTLLDALTPVGSLAVSLTEIPSASLNVKTAAGGYITQDGAVTAYAGASSTAMTASSTNSIWLTAAGVLTVGVSGFPATPHVRLAVVVAGVSTITSVADARQCFPAVGPIADGINLSFGTSTGTEIGTGATQKIGFYGATPIVRPSSTTDLRTALINLGLYATGGASPLSLNGGALTVGSATVADAGNVVLGSTTGTKIGTATSQKLGFYGATPVVQPTVGAGTAGATYTSTEQAMLQAVFNAVRALGLGS